MKKSVRFSADLDTVYLTYSDAEYDRTSGDMFFLLSRPHSAPTSSSTARESSSSSPSIKPKRPLTHRPAPSNKRPMIAPLDLSGIPNACRRTPSLGHQVIVKSQCSGDGNNNSNKPHWQKQHHLRPKLCIDTGAILGTSPRFLTHYNNTSTCRSDDDHHNFHLSPVSPASCY
ncbi:predicted protein [Lichtheimia corymbifera JMRC:FSU:9682]|uniref:Uncharacterized protein n=1 Tax=Lichtheimia corymbifera JMRC:FSU:9682 TaxID=1263082 RepID=A0A068RQ32_9FUNG|nr:predicted protein [Lichtheimia corymbifera JMRC:FSU:9682]